MSKVSAEPSALRVSLGMRRDGIMEDNRTRFVPHGLGGIALEVRLRQDDLSLSGTRTTITQFAIERRSGIDLQRN